MGDLSEHFSKDEMKCKCCGELIVDPKLLMYLEVLREKVGSPINVHDAYRCEKHNKEVGGEPASQHLTGKAADIDIEGLDAAHIFNICRLYRIFSGIGLYDWGCHLDVRDGEFVTWDSRNRK